MAQRVRHLVPILVAAIVGSVLSITAWLVITNWEKRLAEQELSDIAADQTLALQNGIKEYLGKMIAVRALFNASDMVNREEFGIFVDSLLRGQTAILGFSWVPRIRRDERVAHELDAAHDGLTDYHIKAAGPDGSLVVSPEQNEYFPVFYSNAIVKSSIVYGLNMKFPADGTCLSALGTAARWRRRCNSSSSPARGMAFLS